MPENTRFLPTRPLPLASPDENRAERDISSRRADSSAEHASTTQRAVTNRRWRDASRYTTPLTRPSGPAVTSTAIDRGRTSQRPVATAAGRSDTAIELFAPISHAYE